MVFPQFKEYFSIFQIIRSSDASKAGLSEVPHWSLNDLISHEKGSEVLYLVQAWHGCYQLLVIVYSCQEHVTEVAPTNMNSKSAQAPKKSYQWLKNKMNDRRKELNKTKKPPTDITLL